MTTEAKYAASENWGNKSVKKERETRRRMSYARGGVQLHAIQPAVQNELAVWAEKRLKHLMGFDDVGDVVSYVLRLDTGEAVTEYLSVRFVFVL